MTKTTPKTWADYAFTLVIGTIYLYTITRMVFGATFINTSQGALVTIGFFSVVFFMLAFYNRITRIFTGGLALVLAVYVYYLAQTATPEAMHPWVQHFYDILDMATGFAGYDPALGRSLVWALSLLIGAIVVVFMFQKFNFTVLALGIIATFVAVWGPGFARDETSFLLLLFVVLVLGLRRTSSSVRTGVYFAPICALAIAIVNTQLPTSGNIFVRRSINQTFSNAMENLGDHMFTMFNPTYFSFQTTGFSGSGGRLGGPVSINHRTVMEVTGPGGVYLAGATSNTYTGFSWTSTLEDGVIYTHGLPPAQFEMLETAAALIRGATFASQRASISYGNFSSVATGADSQLMQMRYLAALGVVANHGYYLHTFLPVETITINMGRNRTGTVFNPQTAWGLAFTNTGGNYLPLLTHYPIGDILAPNAMSRNTGYQMHFLNINPRLSFVEYVLLQANPGQYSNIPERWWQQATFAGEVTEVGAMNPHAWNQRDEFFRYGGGMSAHISGLPQGEHIILLGDPLRDDYFLELISPDEADLDRMFFPIPNYWRAEGVAFAHLEDFAGHGHFTVADMQALVDMFVASTNGQGQLSYIPREAYLLRWLDSFATYVLAQYAYQVRQAFMEVPEIVPYRVHALTRDIVYGLNSDFERVMAIRDFLLQFPYTLSPAPVPRGVCFVDHFLFVGQEGYCTYFASAMAIMARIAGVPSRYVEGFVLPHSNNPVENTVVTNAMAHAWVEVYLEGFGWLLVEATPTYALGQILPPPTPGGNFASNVDHWRNQGMDMRDPMGDMEVPMGDWDWSGGGQGGAAAVAPVEEPSHFVLPLNIILPALGILCLLAIFISKLWGVFSPMIKAQKASNAQQVLAYWAGILSIVTYYTIPMEHGETPKAYGLHKGKRFAFKSDSVFLRDLIDLYYRAKYSPHDITQAEAELMKEAYFDMLALLKRMRWPVVFAYLRYVRKVGLVTI